MKIVRINYVRYEIRSCMLFLLLRYYLSSESVFPSASVSNILFHLHSVDFGTTELALRW